MCNTPVDCNVVAGYKQLLAQLNTPGGCVSVIPEGIAGIFLASNPDEESVYLSRRKGFCKLAIQGGAGMLPLSFWHMQLPGSCKLPSMHVILAFMLLHMSLASNLMAVS